MGSSDRLRGASDFLLPLLRPNLLLVHHGCYTITFNICLDSLTRLSYVGFLLEIMAVSDDESFPSCFFFFVLQELD